MVPYYKTLQKLDTIARRIWSPAWSSPLMVHASLSLGFPGLLTLHSPLCIPSLQKFTIKTWCNGPIWSPTKNIHKKLQHYT